MIEKVRKIFGHNSKTPESLDSIFVEKAQKFHNENIPKTVKSRKPITNNPSYKFCALSIDGGGVRGMIPAVILKYIEEKTGKRISDLFDLISGTSTGALLGLLTIIPDETKIEKIPKYTAEDIINIYFKECSNIFKKSFVADLICIKGLRRARYNSKIKRQILSKYAKNFKINDLLTDILVPAFDVRYFILNLAKGSLSSSKLQIQGRMNVLDATSSAPTFFKPTMISEKTKGSSKMKSFVDGALVANSPALSALSEAYKNYNANPDNVVVVSLGCGGSKTINDHNIIKNWGAIQWAQYFPISLINASMYTVHFEILQVLKSEESYWRFQTNNLPEERSDIDNATKENLEWLYNEALKYIHENKESLDKLCEILLNNYNIKQQ